MIMGNGMLHSDKIFEKSEIQSGVHLGCIMLSVLFLLGIDYGLFAVLSGRYEGLQSAMISSLIEAWILTRRLWVWKSSQTESN